MPWFRLQNLPQPGLLTCQQQQLCRMQVNGLAGRVNSF